MLKRQFWLGLPADTDPAFMFKIIEDEMYEESMVEGFSNLAEVERFLSIAYKAF